MTVQYNNSSNLTHQLLFMTWCTAACRQRINASCFNTTWLIRLKQKHDIKIDSAIIITLITWSSCLVKKNRSLCSRWSFFITSDLPGLPRPCPCCPCPRWALTVYLSCFLGGQALPSPLPPSWPHFHQVPGNGPLPCQAKLLFLLKLAMLAQNIGYNDVK